MWECGIAGEVALKCDGDGRLVYTGVEACDDIGRCADVAVGLQEEINGGLVMNYFSVEFFFFFSFQHPLFLSNQYINEETPTNIAVLTIVMFEVQNCR